MKKIAVFSSARSDYGLLRKFIELASQKFELDVLVTGNHHSPGHGLTRREIEEDAQNLKIRLIPVEFMVDGTSDQARSKSLALGQMSLAQVFALNSYDALVLLGDRWEIFSASLNALLFGIPLVHISGGEVTEGVIDDSIRHAHTKLAHLHIAANEHYARNLSHMGEEDWRISICGECGLDSIHHSDFATDTEILEKFDINLAEPSILVTFHPSTLDIEVTVENQIQGILAALSRFPNHQLILTGPGAEKGSEIILSKIREFVSTHTNARFVSHFGSRNYLAVLRKTSVVLGNSSSGLVEAASFGVPTVNVGNRQKNRMAADSVLHCGYGESEIFTQLEKTLSQEFQAFSKTCVNPYDPYADGRNSERIVDVLSVALNTMSRDQLLLKKFDLEINANQWNTLLRNFK